MLLFDQLLKIWKLIDLLKFDHSSDLIGKILEDNKLKDILKCRINRLLDKNVELKNIEKKDVDPIIYLIYKLELYYLQLIPNETKLSYLHNMNDLISSFHEHQLILCIQSETYYQIGMIHAIEDRDDDAIEYINKTIEIFQTTGLSVALGHSYILRGQLYRSQFYFEKSLEDLSRADKLFQNHEIVSQYGRLKVILGSVNYYFGEFNTSERNYLDAIEYTQKYNEPRLEAVAVRSLGVIAMSRGDIKTSHKLMQKSIELAKLHNVADHGFLFLYYYNKGQLLFQEGRYQEAIDNMNRSMEESKNPEVEIFLVYPMFYQFQSYLILKNTSAIEELLDQLNQIKQKGEIGQMKEKAIKMIQAQYLKSKPRITDKITALSMLKELVKSHRSDFEFRLMQYMELCDLLLDEFRLYKEEEVLNEISDILEEIVVIKKHSNSITADIELQLLRAELMAINGEVDNAMKLLDDLQDFSTEKDLGYVCYKIKMEQEKIRSDFLDWQNIISTNDNLKSQINNSKINDYIAYATELMPSLTKN